LNGNDCAGECGNKECPFLHIDPEKKIKVCAWYDRGFCRHGNCCSIPLILTQIAIDHFYRMCLL